MYVVIRARAGMCMCTVMDEYVNVFVCAGVCVRVCVSLSVCVCV